MQQLLSIEGTGGTAGTSHQTGKGILHIGSKIHQLIFGKFKDVLHGRKVLVAGYGNIGKVLSWMLKGMGADVWVSARKEKDLAWIQVFGYHPVNTADLAGKKDFSVIFNTIPAVVFTAKVLAGLSTQTKIIDLASAPGGVDLDAAEKLGIPVLQALSLPGKVAPVEAGRIIKDTIYSMMEE